MKAYLLILKVVLLEDLAAHFKMKTQEVIDRIASLQVNFSKLSILSLFKEGGGGMIYYLKKYMPLSVLCKVNANPNPRKLHE